jgi:hypothetical protein
LMSTSRSEEGSGGLNTDPHQLSPQHSSIPLEKNLKKSWKKRLEEKIAIQQETCMWNGR